MLYQIIDGTLAAGSEIVLEHFDFEVKGQDKIAIVGPNGAGKTTLLRLIAGELSLERDDKRQGKGIRLARNVTIGMLSQQAFSDTNQTVEDMMMAICPARDTWERERFEFEQEYDRVFTGFGFSKEDKAKKISEFSGGEQTKIAMIRLLLEQPDILLLDEPTNHLDVETVEWLERYLRGYKKAVVEVSHDRFFLDQTVDIVYELTDKKLVRYVGNYTEYRQQKLKKIAIPKKQYEQQQAEVQRLEDLIKRFKNKPKKAAFARSRKKILERMEMLEKPETMQSHLFTGEIVPEVLGGKWVLEAEKLQIGYNTPLLELSLRIKRGQKIGIIGPNGAGKSTFLKTAVNILQPLKGKCQLGLNITIGYFEQQVARMDSDKKVFEHFTEKFPSMIEKDVRNYLASYLFRGADVYQSVNQLSGGEKSRLILAEILAAKPNFLVLDEPTNHMDIPAKETLESAFKAYKGTVLFVSHDRYFIEEVAESLLIFENGEVSYYPFGYKHYIERKERMEELRHIAKTSGQFVRTQSSDENEKGFSDDMAAKISAEDQVLISELQNVPKGATLLGRELSTEQAFLDWQLRLAKEAMDKAEENAVKWQKHCEQLTEEVYQQWMEEKIQNFSVENLRMDKVLFQDTMDSEEVDTAVVDDMDNVDKQLLLDESWSQWEQACLKWYDIWSEIHPEKVNIENEEI